MEEQKKFDRAKKASIEEKWRPIAQILGDVANRVNDSCGFCEEYADCDSCPISKSICDTGKGSLLIKTNRAVWEAFTWTCKMVRALEDLEFKGKEET